MTRTLAAAAAAISLVLIVVLLVQVSSLRGDVEAAHGEALAATETARELGDEIAELRDAFRALSDELATIPRRGVVPTDSSGLILERLTEIRDEVTELAERVDAICRNAPVALC